MKKFKLAWLTLLAFGQYAGASEGREILHCGYYTLSQTDSVSTQIRGKEVVLPQFNINGMPVAAFTNSEGVNYLSEMTNVTRFLIEELENVALENQKPSSGEYRLVGGARENFWELTELSAIIKKLIALSSRESNSETGRWNLSDTWGNPSLSIPVLNATLQIQCKRP